MLLQDLIGIIIAPLCSMKWVLFIAISVWFLSCNENTDYTDIEIGPGEFLIGSDESQEISAEPYLKLDIGEITDSRCPAGGFTCIWAGSAQVPINIIGIEYQLADTLCIGDCLTGPYNNSDSLIFSIGAFELMLRLNEVIPYPNSKNDHLRKYALIELSGT